MNFSVLRSPVVKKLFARHEPGLLISQYGQFGSSELISFLQLGHRIDFRVWFIKNIPCNDDLGKSI
jgi:hypothetical protein